jgi:hypothetical protein
MVLRLGCTFSEAVVFVGRMIFSGGTLGDAGCFPSLSDFGESRESLESLESRDSRSGFGDARFADSLMLDLPLASLWGFGDQRFSGRSGLGDRTDSRSGRTWPLSFSDLNK